MKKIRKNFNKGVTIIALVVTIVVLLILAGISIAAITGDNGIINKSDKARIETEIATYKEQLEVIWYPDIIDKSLHTGGKQSKKIRPITEKTTKNIIVFRGFL